MTANLLIVDDDEFIRAVTQEALEQCGYIVGTAVDGQDAWEILISNPVRYDLMLLDKQMPRLDGIALLQRVRADGRFTDLPVIMLTGDSSQEDIIQGLAEGAHYYLVKPSTEDVLKIVIQNTLGEFRKKQELRDLIGRQANHLNLLRYAEFTYRTLPEAKDLALLLADASMNPSRTVTGYSELLINAVEHGNLGISYHDKSQLLSEGRWHEEVETRLQHPDYAQREVKVILEKTPTRCCVTIIDQGQGFDWRKYIDFNPDRAFDLHGRGIAMSKAMSFDHLEYQGNGNTVSATVHLSTY